MLAVPLLTLSTTLEPSYCGLAVHHGRFPRRWGVANATREYLASWRCGVLRNRVDGEQHRRIQGVFCVKGIKQDSHKIPIKFAIKCCIFIADHWMPQASWEQSHSTHSPPWVQSIPRVPADQTHPSESHSQAFSFDMGDARLSMTFRMESKSLRIDDRTEEYLKSLKHLNQRKEFLVKAKVNVKARHGQTNAVPRFWALSETMLKVPSSKFWLRILVALSSLYNHNLGASNYIAKSMSSNPADNG